MTARHDDEHRSFGPLPRADEGTLRLGAGAPAAPPRERSGARVPQFSSEQLFAGAAEVLIEHRGAIYRLKQTSLGKLILTK
jgi:hemin uptake protein HemP